MAGCMGLSGRSGELKLVSDFIRFGERVSIEDLITCSGVTAGLLSCGGALESKAGSPAAFKRSALGRSLNS